MGFLELFVYVVFEESSGNHFSDWNHQSELVLAVYRHLHKQFTKLVGIYSGWLVGIYSGKLVQGILECSG